MAHSAEAVSDITSEVATQTPGVGFDASVLAMIEAGLGAGATLDSIAAGMQGSAYQNVSYDADGNVNGSNWVLEPFLNSYNVANSFYETVLGRAPSLDERSGILAALSTDLSPSSQLTLWDQAGNVLGQARADELLIQLPLFVTMNGGATPKLLLPGGTVLGDGAQVAAFLLGMEGRAGRLDQRTMGIYNEVAGWLDLVGQQLLQLAWTMSQLSQGETDGNRQAIDIEVAKLAEALAAVPPSARGQVTDRLHLAGHQADVSLVIDPLTGEWTYKVHDIAGSTDWFKIVVEAVGLIATAVLVVATGGGATPLVFVEAGALTAQGVAAAVVISTSLIEAGESFANGDVLGGLLSIASAVGVSFQGNLLQLGNAAQAAKIGGLILAARGIIGGVASAVQSAEAGNTLGLVSSILSVAASAAAGDVALQTDTSAEAVAALKAGTALPGSGPSEALKDVGLFLTGLSTATNIADAYNRGDIQGGLMASLNGVLTAYSIINQVSTDSALQSGIAAPISTDVPAPMQNGPVTGLLGIGVVSVDVEVAADIRDLRNIHEAAVDEAARQYEGFGFKVTRNVSFQDQKSGVIAVADLVLSRGAGPVTGNPLNLSPEQAAMLQQTPSGVPLFAVEVKTGNAGYSVNQRVVYPALRAGQSVLPFGPRSIQAGFPPGVPITVPFQVQLERR